MEMLVVVGIFALLSALAIKPMNGWLDSIKAKQVGDGLKNYLLLARSRAIANPARHCGVAFIVHPASSPLDDSAIAFFDKVPTNNVYNKGVDSVYSKPYVFNKKDSVSVATQGSSVIVFRGDGSANISLKAVVTTKSFRTTVDVLASTGRVKVVKK
jgi:Tfp pilus assembly protein FimT